MAEIIIIGGGPAGLSAGIYTARAGRETLIIDNGDCTACKIDRLDNYLGFPRGISGKELIQRGREQARRFGCTLLTQEVLVARQKEETTFMIETEQDSYSAQAIILATGASYQKPGIEGIENFEGRGVSFCVQCDGYFFRDRKIAVIGSQNLAGKEVIDLTNYTRNITLFTNAEKLHMNKRFLKWLRENRIPIRKERILRVVGEKGLEGLKLRTGETFQCQGVFLAIGSSGAVNLARQLGVVTKGNFIQVNRRHQTNVPRVYATGDCTGANRQIAIAMGEGADTAINLISELKGTRWVGYGGRFK